MSYYSDIDYIDHFAWVTLTGTPSASDEEPVGTGRYFRLAASPETAELALAIVDDAGEDATVQ